MVDILRCFEAPNAPLDGRELRIPWARLSADLEDLSVADVGVDDTSSAAVVGAGPGNDVFAWGGSLSCVLTDCS